MKNQKNLQSVDNKANENHGVENNVKVGRKTMNKLSEYNLCAEYKKHLNYKDETTRPALYDDAIVQAESEYPLFYLLNMGNNERGIREAFNRGIRERVEDMYKSFEPEEIEPSFIKGLDDNKEKMMKKYGDVNIRESIGITSGFWVFKQWLLSYSITSSSYYFNIRYRQNIPGSVSFVGWGVEPTLNNIVNNVDNNKRESNQEMKDVLAIGVLAVLFKNIVEERTVYTKPHEGKIQWKPKASTELDLPFTINRLDASWYTTYCRTDGFLVSGHFRMQPCGRGRQDRKLIYIKPFMKDGYVRRARMFVEVA